MFTDRSIDSQVTVLFNEDRRHCLPIEEIEKTKPDIVGAIDGYLGSEDFLKVSGGKTWKEIQTKNKGKLRVIVDIRSVDAILSGKGKPYIKYMVKDTHDSMGIRDFLGTRTDLIVMIGHHIPVTGS